jgi:hypothetical protein
MIPIAGTVGKVAGAVDRAMSVAALTGTRLTSKEVATLAGKTYLNVGQIPRLVKAPVSAVKEGINIRNLLYKNKPLEKPALVTPDLIDEGLLTDVIVRRYVEDLPENIPFDVITPQGTILKVVKEKVGYTNQGLYKIYPYGGNPEPRGAGRGKSKTGEAIAMYADEKIEMLMPSTFAKESDAIALALPKYIADMQFRGLMEGAGARSPREIDFSGILDETVGKITDFEKRGILERELGWATWSQHTSNWREIWARREMGLPLIDLASV